MEKPNLIKELLFSIKKKLIAYVSFLNKIIRITKRALFYKDVITPLNCFDVPIIINNRNRYTYLKSMIDQLVGFGYKNIFILDNDSSYPPLIDYYKHVKAKIIFLHQNVGYKALWETPVFEQFKNKYYVYSDPDILMSINCPKNFVYVLYSHLKDYTWAEKAGVALRIDDLHDCYKFKEDILNWEKVNWSKLLKPMVYDAPVDTTLALYKPLSYGSAEECSAIRVAGDLTAQHLPWYIDSENLTEEEQYYRNSITKTSSYWSNK